MKGQLVLVGGGHAHMVTLANIRRFVDKGYGVTVIGPSDYHYYSGMGPGMLGKTYAPEDIRFATGNVVEKQGGQFVPGSATHIDPKLRIVKLASGEDIVYDVLSVNAGSYVPQSLVTEDKGDIFSVKPIETLQKARSRIIELTSQKKILIAIVGGGPSSTEIAGNVWQLVKHIQSHMPVIKIFSGGPFMGRFPDKIRKSALAIMVQRNIEVHDGDYVKEIKTGTIRMESGKTHLADVIFLASGVRSSAIFRDSGIPVGPDDGMIVNKYLQCPRHPEIFGGGDCIYFQDEPLDKVGVYAVRENPILCHNLMAALEGSVLKAFDPGGPYLLVFNMGGGIGILNKRWITFSGRLAFKIKDYIDRRFMMKFQAIEQYGGKDIEGVSSENNPIFR
ncbi:MAG: FAD-dependent oxidoreductase [Desulfobacterales bacterium]|nr:FAD-dependent oxidoreductase [Desulfobacterales bacterium]